jgi:hypothetical protein
VVNGNDHFIEKRKLSTLEVYLVKVLEDIEVHGLTGDYYGYWLETIHLGKRGEYRVLCNKKEKILIGKRKSLRIRKESENQIDTFYIFVNGNLFR